MMAETGFLRYVPGQAIAFAGRRVAVLADLTYDHLLVDRVLAAVGNGGSSDDALDALVSSGVRAVPDFAIAELTTSGFRVLVRGSFMVVPDDQPPIHGPAGPWADVIVPASGLRLCAGASLSGRSMPFAGGVVLADELLVSSAVRLDPAATTEAEAPPAMLVGDPDVVVGALAADRPVSAPPVLPAEPSAPAPDFDFLFAATGMRPAPPVEIEVDLPRVEERRYEVSGPQALVAAETRPAYVTRVGDSVGTSPEASPAVAGTRATGGMITGMPWLDPEPPDLQPVPTPTLSREQMRTVDPASPSARAFEAPSMSSDAPPDSGSVERTISRAQLRGRGATAPTVVAARCPVGHLSPAYAGVCRVCREPLPSQQPFEAPRPTLGVLRLSTGGIVTLDRGAIIGRNPRIPSGFRGREQPNLVQVVDPEKDVSSQHLEITLDFWNVVVRDLDSTNGTEVVLPGEMPVTLRADVPQILEPGSKVVMGGTVSFTFEVTA